MRNTSHILALIAILLLLVTTPTLIADESTSQAPRIDEQDKAEAGDSADADVLISAEQSVLAIDGFSSAIDSFEAEMSMSEPNQSSIDPLSPTNVGLIPPPKPCNQGAYCTSQNDPVCGFEGFCNMASNCCMCY